MRQDCEVVEGKIRTLRESLDRHGDIIEGLKTRVDDLEDTDFYDAPGSEDTNPLNPSFEDFLSNVASVRRQRIGITRREMDGLSWPVFDLDPRLNQTGGWYVLDNLLPDMVGHACDESVILKLRRATLEDVVESAQRWCDQRSGWYKNRKYWITQVSEWIIIKRNRYVFQV